MQNSRSSSKSSSTKKGRLPLYIAGAAILVAGMLLGLKLGNYWPFSGVSIVDLNATRNEKTDNPTSKNNNPTDKDSLDANNNTDKTTDEIPVSDSLIASITQLAETNNVITFAAEVQNTKTAGTCVVTFSNANDRPVTKQFTATSSGAVSTCGPTTIPATEFSYLGIWQVSFHYYEGDAQATTQSEINIQ